VIVFQIAPEIREVFRLAADLLERDGWCQKSYLNADGKRCIKGAVYDAAMPVELRIAAKDIIGMRIEQNERYDVYLKASYILDEAIVETTDGLAGTVATAIGWNDLPERTQEQAVTFLRWLGDGPEAEPVDEPA